MGWFAEKIGYSHAHVRQVACGGWPASDRFRAAVAARARELGWDEAELFDQGGTSSAGPPHGGADDRAGTAGSGLYAVTHGVSSLQEAPLTEPA